MDVASSEIEEVGRHDAGYSFQHEHATIATQRYFNLEFAFQDTNKPMSLYMEISFTEINILAPK